jgi:hypothetical protein
MSARISGLLVLLVLLFLATLAAIPAGCGRKQERWTLSLDVGGRPGGPAERQVFASIDGHVGDPHKIDQQGDSAIITFIGGTLVVEKTRITLDGKEVAKVPEGAKKVAFDYSAGKLTGTADGVTVLEMAVGR